MAESMTTHVSNWFTREIVNIAMAYQHLVAQAEALRQLFNDMNRAMLSAGTTHRNH